MAKTLLQRIQKIPKRIRHGKKSAQWLWQNRVAARRIRRELANPKSPISDLLRYERKIYSQNGEDGILEAIFTLLGVTNRFFVEFGVRDGRQCNTAYLSRKKKWNGLMMDIDAGVSPSGIPIHKEFVNAENVEALFKKYSVPKQFDLLSIDIDGNDYWVWRAIQHFEPRVVAIEYNGSVPVEQAKTIPYDPNFRWPGTTYYGASLHALVKLARQKRYTLINCDSSGTNAFFVQDSLLQNRFAPQSMEQLYRRPNYGGGKGHPAELKRSMINV